MSADGIGAILTTLLRNQVCRYDVTRCKVVRDEKVVIKAHAGQSKFLAANNCKTGPDSGT